MLAGGRTRGRLLERSGLAGKAGHLPTFQAVFPGEERCVGAPWGGGGGPEPP
jgi:hypothetical protein